MPRFWRNAKFWFVLILVIAAVLRVYRLPEYLHFLGDEGRDVLVVKRIIVDHKLVFLGPTASVGGFFTGPIYYYFMAPFLWLSGLDPVGPAFLCVLFGLGLVSLIYKLCSMVFDQKTGLIAAFLGAISPQLVAISRFSWNPNPVPFFAILTIFFLYLSTKKRESLFVFLAGVSLGIMVELHYLELIFIPIVGLSILLIFPWRKWLKLSILVALGFVVGEAPFLSFEVRHGFPNIIHALEFVTRGQGANVSPREVNLLALFIEIVTELFQRTTNLSGLLLQVITYSSLGGFAYWCWQKFKKKADTKAAKIILVWLIIGSLGLGSYRGALYDHYFTFLFPLPFIFMGVLANYLLQRKILWPIFLAIVVTVSYFQIKGMYFWDEPNNLLRQTQDIDRIVLGLAGDRPYNLALLADRNSDFAYRYYLEIWNRAPVTIETDKVDPGRKTITDQLIVICEQKDCKPVGHPEWEIAGFGMTQVQTVKEAIAGIKVYKLIHYYGQ